MNTISFFDRPSKEDRLDSDQIIKSLAELIKRATKPFVLAVVGEWGSGKTTLIDLSFKEIEDNYSIVKFNAWSHSKGVPLLKGLLAHLAEKEGGAWDKVKKDLKSLAKSPIATAAIRGVGSLAGPAGIILSEIASKGIESLEKGKQKGDEDYNVDTFIQQFKKISNIFEQENKPLLIFIDDLDRCNPSESLDLIDDIKVYLTVDAPVIFVVAIDRRTLSMGIRAKYGVEVEISVDDYLQKIFSYVVYMPRFSQIDQVIKDVVSNVGKKEESVDLVEIAKELITNYELKNLRSIKRVVRRWAFLLPSNINNYLRAAGLKDDGKLESYPDKLCRFLLLLNLLFELYPDYYEAMMHPVGRATPLVPGKLSERESWSSSDSFFDNYLRFKGFQGDFKSEIVRLKHKNQILLKIITDLMNQSFLFREEVDILKNSYTQSVPTIIDSVWLGLPLIE